MWSGKQPTCSDKIDMNETCSFLFNFLKKIINYFVYVTAVDCGPLPLLLNGSHVGNLTTYPNKIVFSCDDGFLLRGSAERFCQANRTWSGTQTKCEGNDFILAISNLQVAKIWEVCTFLLLHN